MKFDLPEIRVEIPGPFALHNMPCTVCRVRYAVLDLNTGIMQPCWGCQDDGWEVRRKRRWRPWA